MIAGRWAAEIMAAKLILSEEEWRKRLSPEEFRVLRQHGTEPPGEGCFLGTSEPAPDVCGACGKPLCKSGEKSESGTGCPPCTGPITEDAVVEVEDRSCGMVGTEVRCARCDSYLGHVFPDGPPPTG